MRVLLIALLLLAAGCSDSDNQTSNNANNANNANNVNNANNSNNGNNVPTLDPTTNGPYAIGVRSVQYEDTDRSRTLDVEIWYPAEEAGSGSILDFESGENRTTLEGLLGQENCATQTTASNRDARVADGGPWPVVVFSHCHNCMRYSAFSTAERLASHGFVVVAPDHEDNTMFDELAGNGIALGPQFLEVRRQDIELLLPVLDSVTGIDIDTDEDRFAVMGHSFGSVTAGYVAQENSEVKAAMGIAAPMENPLLPGVTISDIDRPVMLILAVEDNSITTLGNNILRDNFADANSPAWLVSVEDAGHWNFSDIAGLTDFVRPGCGDDERMTNGEEFTYLDINTGRDIAATYATAFFAHTLLGQPASIIDQNGWSQVTVEVKD